MSFKAWRVWYLVQVVKWKQANCFRAGPWPPINGASFETRGSLTGQNPSDVTTRRRRTSQSLFAYVGPVGPRLRRPRPTATPEASSGTRGFLTGQNPSDVTTRRRRASQTLFAYIGPVRTRMRRAAAGRLSGGPPTPDDGPMALANSV